MFASVRTLIAALLLLCGGCVSRDHCPVLDQCRPTTTDYCDCTPVERQQLVPDVSLVSQAASPDKPILCALPEAEVQCRAARNSTIASLLTQEADAIQRPAGILPWGSAPS